MRATLLATGLVVGCLAGCGGGDPAPSPEEQPARSGQREVPARGYTCGELRSESYRERQADALLDEWRVDPARRARQRKRLMRALFVACDPGPDYRRAAHAVARRVLGPKPSS